MAPLDEDHQVRALAAILSDAAGEAVSIDSVEALSGGAASMSHKVEARRGDSDWPLILQRSFGATETAALSRALQAAVQTRAGRAGVPVARVVRVLTPQDRLGEGFIMEFIAGETIAPRYLRGERYAPARASLTRDSARALATLHAIPRAELTDLALPERDGPAELRSLRDTYDGLDGQVPLFELAFAALEASLQRCDGPVLVHGDFRSGNFIVGKEGLRAVLDWELAHVGDPLLDIGWLCTNTWRFGNWDRPVGGFGEREAFYAAYEEAGGRAIDRERARAFELLGSLRWGVMCMMMASAHLSGEAVSVERAAIGRRISEVEADIAYALRHGNV